MCFSLNSRVFIFAPADELVIQNLLSEETKKARAI